MSTPYYHAMQAELVDIEEATQLAIQEEYKNKHTQVRTVWQQC